MIHALCLILLAGAPPQEGAPPDEKKIRELGEKLNADDLAERTQAEADLAAMGEAVIPVLEKLRPQAGAEARARIDNVIADVTLARRWLKELSEEPDPGQAHQRLEQAFASKALDRKQLARIVSHALLSDAGENLRPYMFSMAERHRLREIWPALVQLALRDDSDGYNVISHLQRLRPPREAVDEIVKIIPRIRNRGTFAQILELVISLRPERARLDAAVIALLDGGVDDDLRMNLLNYLQQGRLSVSLGTALRCWRGSRTVRQSYGKEAVLRIPPDDSVKEILDLLASGEADEAVLAAEYVARHKVAGAALPLAEALEKCLEEEGRGVPGAGRRWFGAQPVETDEGPLKQALLQALRALGPGLPLRQWLAAEGGRPSRAVAAALIGELEARGLAGELAGLMEDRDPKVRREAARSAAALRIPEAVPRLEARLKDGDVEVRQAALQALAQIRGAAATATVLGQLRADHPDVRAAAVELLPRMDLEKVFDELTRPESLGLAFHRYALAAVIASVGESAVHRVMARAGENLSVEKLNEMVKLIQAARER